MSKRTTSNVRTLKPALSKAVKAISQGLEEGVEEAAHAVRDDWKANVAVDEGDYRDAIAAHTRGTHADVSVFDREIARRAIYPEFGTSRQPAQPSALPAAERERKRFVKRLAKAVERKL